MKIFTLFFRWPLVAFGGLMILIIQQGEAQPVSPFENQPEGDQGFRWKDGTPFCFNSLGASGLNFGFVGECGLIGKQEQVPAAGAAGLNLTASRWVQVNIDQVDFSKSILSEAWMFPTSAREANFSEVFSARSRWVGHFQEANFTRARLRETEFEGDFTGADFSESEFINPLIRRSIFLGAKFEAAKLHRLGIDNGVLGPTGRHAFEEVNFRNADLRGAYVVSAQMPIKSNIFDGADLRWTRFPSAIFQSSRFREAKLAGAFFNGAQFHSCFFERAEAPFSDFAEIQIDASSTFQGANLEYSNFRGARLFGTSFESANLRGSDLSSAVFSQVNLSGADLRDANLIAADLSTAALRNSKMNSKTKIQMSKNALISRGVLWIEN